jgi:hypothetical protein
MVEFCLLAIRVDEPILLNARRLILQEFLLPVPTHALRRDNFDDQVSRFRQILSFHYSMLAKLNLKTRGQWFITLRHNLKPHLSKMMIKGKNPVELQAAGHGQQRAIDVTPGFVLMLFENIPGGLFVRVGQ